MSLDQFSDGLCRPRTVRVFEVGPSCLVLPEGATLARRQLILLLVDLVIGWKLGVGVPTQCRALLSPDG